MALQSIIAGCPPTHSEMLLPEHVLTLGSKGVQVACAALQYGSPVASHAPPIAAQLKIDSRPPSVSVQAETELPEHVTPIVEQAFTTPFERQS